MHSSFAVSRVLYSFRRFDLQRISLCLVCLLAMAAPCLRAQSTFGTVLGTVQDASGAVVPGATVTLLNTGTTAQRVATSNNSGGA